MPQQISLDTFVKYMRDAVNRFQIEQERAGPHANTFSFWWRRLHEQVRSERPRTVELQVSTAVGDAEEFKANLPTRPKAKKT